MEHPFTKKEFQQFIGHVAILSRFISWPAKIYLPFFKTLRQTKSFEWTNDYNRAFEELKIYLGSPSLLSKPEEGKTLYLYLSTSSEVINLVLVREEDKGMQKPIYHASQVFHDIETMYSKIEKLIYTLIIATQCLRLYFQIHSVVVLTDHPLKAILQFLDTSRWMAK